uniref:Uncharacterized protein n=1 Tax=Anguilla anguilla TaxID=7936 RepID=A0A0E9TBF6_ANGAN
MYMNVELKVKEAVMYRNKCRNVVGRRVYQKWGLPT